MNRNCNAKALIFFRNVKVVLFAACAWACAFYLNGNVFAAYDLTGEWTGACRKNDIIMSLVQSGKQATGTLAVGTALYNLEGTVDNGTFHAQGKRTKGFMPLSCEGDFSIEANGQMSGTITFSQFLSLFSSSCDVTLYNKNYVINYSLLMGYVQNPSNIYLFFSMEDYKGDPVTGLNEGDFEIYEDDHLISVYESSQTILPNPKLFTLATVLLLDMSGSILEAETLNSLKESAKEFLGQIAGDEGQEVAVYLFDGREAIKELSPFTKDAHELQTAIESLSKEAVIRDPEYDISTNLNGAVQQGLSALDAKQGTIISGELFSGTLVTFTDGTDQAARVSNSAAVSSVTASRHKSFTIGLGGEIDEAHLRALGKTGFAPAENSGELNSAFDQIALTIQNESAKNYILGYCTPTRKGDHEVMLKAKGYIGSLSYAFNADGFSGGCDPLDILQGPHDGDTTQCLLTLQPDSIAKALLGKFTRITITGTDAQFSKSSTVSIADATVLASFYYDPTKLSVIAHIPAKTKAGKKDVTVTTDDRKLTCYDALTVK